MRSSRFNSVLLASLLLVVSPLNAVAAAPSNAIRTQLVASPYEALQRAAGMVGDSKRPAVSAQEYALLRDVSEGRAARWTLAEASLIASGVMDSEDRRHYLSRFEEIRKEAAEETADAETIRDKADALVHFLFKKPLHGGFVSGQVDMRKVLEDGEFNCVSSAILFDIVGRPLGINARPETAPGHVFLRAGDFYIEPILNKTYSTEEHEEIVDDLWKKANDFVAGAFGELRSYESTNLGLVGLIYFDEGERLSREKNYGEAVVYELKALCLDGNNPLFRRCLEDNLQKWFASNMDGKRFEQAQTVASMYGQLSGDRPSTAKMFRELAGAMNRRSSVQIAAVR